VTRLVFMINIDSCGRTTTHFKPAGYQEQFPKPENWKVPMRFKRQNRKRNNRRSMDAKSGRTKK